MTEYDAKKNYGIYFWVIEIIRIFCFYECPRKKMVASPNSDLVKGVTFLKESIWILRILQHEDRRERIFVDSLFECLFRSPSW